MSSKGWVISYARHTITGRKYVTRLYNELVPYYPDFKDPVPLKETIYQRMYPGKPYSDTRMRNLTSDLMSLTEKFISIEAFTADKFSGELYLMEALPAKSMDDMFRRKYRKAAESAAGSNGEPRNETDYLNRLRLESARSIFVNRRLPNDARENAECYQGIVNETVKFFLASLFKNYALMLNKSTTFYKYEFDTRFIDLILWYMDEGINEYTGDTCIMLYYYFTVFYRNYDEAFYLKLEEFTYNNFDATLPFPHCPPSRCHPRCSAPASLSSVLVGTAATGCWQWKSTAWARATALPTVRPVVPAARFPLRAADFPLRSGAPVVPAVVW
ncbi:MAG: hypothetical protein V9H26_25660 [Verrucomicrobiota bacterium]